MPDLLFFLFLGHYVGDFALQSNYMAQNKGSSKALLSWHVLIYTSTLALFLAYGLMLQESNSFLSLTTFLVLAAVYTIHWIQDSIKSRKFNGSKQAYYMDQAIHVITLLIIRIYIYAS